jgi:hypothetical protein
VDMNVVATGDGALVEVQGTAERHSRGPTSTGCSTRRSRLVKGAAQALWAKGWTSSDDQPRRSASCAGWSPTSPYASCRRRIFAGLRTWRRTPRSENAAKKAGPRPPPASMPRRRLAVRSAGARWRHSRASSRPRSRGGEASERRALRARAGFGRGGNGLARRSEPRRASPRPAAAV